MLKRLLKLKWVILGCVVIIIWFYCSKTDNTAEQSIYFSKIGEISPVNEMEMNINDNITLKYKGEGKDADGNRGIEVILDNRTGEEYECTPIYLIEYEQDGAWYSVLSMPGEKKGYRPSIEIADFAPSGRETSVFLPMHIYGELPKGRYRVLLGAKYRGEELYVADERLCCEFCIE